MERESEVDRIRALAASLRQRARALRRNANITLGVIVLFIAAGVLLFLFAGRLVITETTPTVRF